MIRPMAEQNSIATGLTALSQILEREKARGVDTLLLKPETDQALRALPVELMKAAAEEEKDEKWVRAQLNAIFKDAKSSKQCRNLGTLRDQIVFAVGNPMADLMFVGEAPGSEEEKERKPFVGPAGRKLDQIIGAMGLKREDVYVSNIVKFRPKKGDGRFQGTSNRKPESTEMAASIQYIRREIEVVRPKAIVALGGTAAEGLLEVGGSVSSLRNQVHDFHGVPVVVTYHPSFLLRQEREGDAQKAMAMKRRVWEDILKVMELLEMPISEKQRGYFL